MTKWTDIGAIAATWEKDEYGWQIAPIGLECIQAGARASIGEWARNPHDLGYANNFKIILAEVDGVPWIGGGCKWLRLDAALAYVADRPDRAEVMDRIRYAATMAERFGWKVPDEGKS